MKTTAIETSACNLVVAPGDWQPGNPVVDADIPTALLGLGPDQIHPDFRENFHLATAAARVLVTQTMARRVAVVLGSRGVIVERRESRHEDGSLRGVDAVEAIAWDAL